MPLLHDPAGQKGTQQGQEDPIIHTKRSGSRDVCGHEEGRLGSLVLSVSGWGSDRQEV